MSYWFICLLKELSISYCSFIIEGKDTIDKVVKQPSKMTVKSIFGNAKFTITQVFLNTLTYR